MTIIEINRIPESVGERRWRVSVITEGGVTVLESTTPLTKGVALDAAKALRHQGPNAPLVGEPPFHGPAWVPEKDGDKWLLKFTEVNETLFDLQIGNVLQTADVAWNPPDADPALPEKEDTTPATHDGS